MATNKKRAEKVEETAVKVPETFGALGRELVRTITTEGAPGAFDTIQRTKQLVLALVVPFRDAVRAGKRPQPEGAEFNALVKDLVSTLTTSEDTHVRGEVRQLVTSGRYWGLNLLSPSEKRRAQAERSRDRQEGRKVEAKAKPAATPKVETKQAETKQAVSRDEQEIALAVTNARRRGVKTAAIVAALDALK